MYNFLSTKGETLEHGEEDGIRKTSSVTIRFEFGLSNWAYLKDRAWAKGSVAFIHKNFLFDQGKRTVLH